MPFQSKRQWRAAMAGHIPGIDKEKAREWAHETDKPFKKLPDRAPAEKGKRTLLSKEARMFGVLGRLRRSGVSDPIKPALEALNTDVAKAYDAVQSGNTLKTYVDEAREEYEDFMDEHKPRKKKAEDALVRLCTKLAMGVVKLPSMKLPGVKKPPGAMPNVINPRRSITQAITAGTNSPSR